MRKSNVEGDGVDERGKKQTVPRSEEREGSSTPTAPSPHHVSASQLVRRVSPDGARTERPGPSCPMWPSRPGEKKVRGQAREGETVEGKGNTPCAPRLRELEPAAASAPLTAIVSNLTSQLAAQLQPAAEDKDDDSRMT